MISAHDLYGVLCAVVPLYVTMFLAYASVKRWNMFTPDQCTGINKFVAYFAVPLLSLEFISKINPYKMNLLFIAADAVSKMIVLILLLIWAKLWPRGSLEWSITLFSLSTLPNTLVLGIPLLKSMYGEDKEGLMIQVVVMQCIVWYTLLLFLFEYREARIEVMMDESLSSKESVGASDHVVSVVAANGSGGASASRDAAEDSVQFGRVVSVDGEAKEVHLFIWRCGCCISEEVCERAVQLFRREENKERKKENETTEINVNDKKNSNAKSSTSNMLFQILKTVWHKLIRNPNSYASFVGLSWALVSCRWGVKMPEIVENSITILSNAGLGMAVFSLGLFMASQTRIIGCGKKMAMYGMIARFVGGPAVMAVASVGVGLRSTTLKVSIVQAALPQGIVPFVFAREYHLHPDVLSTAVIFGMIVSLPITMLYYILLGL